MKRKQSKRKRYLSNIWVLSRMLERAYDKVGWHGPNLRGSIRGLSAAQAGWRPRVGRHCIADIVVHCAYWKYAVRRRLTGEQRGSFPLKGSNWFELPPRLTDADWNSYRRLLENEHRQLRDAVADFRRREDELLDNPPNGQISYLRLIIGIASHDLYHTGQIQLLKRLQAGKRG